ncbi:MAG: hypothetical protein EXS32_16470 [Opitutus sp.]|nr:hypothetical protein [Opitutus sp.]
MAIIFLLIFGMLVVHWTQTRTEPTFLKPAVDLLAPYIPGSAPIPAAPPRPPAAKSVKPVKR